MSQSGAIPAEVTAVKSIFKACLASLTRSSAKNFRAPSFKRTGKTQVTFDLPDLFIPGSNPVDNAKALQILLHCLCAIDACYLHFHPVTPTLYQSGVIYDRTTVWDSIPALYARGYGDCKSLTCALIAEYTVQGIQALPVFRFITSKDGQNFYHILVQTPKGFEDPSKVLGMGQNENAYFKKTG